MVSSPPPILSCLTDGEGGDSSDDEHLWLVDEARHLLDTFGGGAVIQWARCQREGCGDGECICLYVQQGVDHYGEWAEPIASILSSVTAMADDEAVESDE